MKMPALQFYPADWRKDPAVQALGYFERGVWFEMLCLMHESCERGVLLLNGIPMPEEALSNALGLDNQILSTTLTKLLTYGVAKKREGDGAIFSKRMVQDEKLCQVRREAGKKGGNPVLLNQNSTTGVNQNPTPSSSSSSSSSEIIKTSSLPATPKADPIPYQKIIALYHEHLPTLPKVLKLTSTRKGQIAARWKSGDIPDLETWESYFKFVSQSPFLMGHVAPKPGYSQFIADLEWITNETNFTKIWEKKFHGKV